jgi:predicted DNA-binding protein (MmcQ/YjbR family)
MSKTEASLRKYALSYPGTTEEFPWEHRVFKVNKKIFAFLDFKEGVASLTVKLPKSGKQVLKSSWAEPTGYGMGKHGWVSCEFEEAELPVGKVRGWIDESYRAIAPKKLVKQLDEGAAPAAEAETEARAPKVVSWSRLSGLSSPRRGSGRSASSSSRQKA